MLLTIAFGWLSSFTRDTSRLWLYFDLVLIGAGLGLSLLTLLIAVQQAVPRTQLGTATSLNQFSRSIGGALGVALMGAFLTAGLSTQLHAAADRSLAGMKHEQAERLGSNPNALVDPSERAKMPAEQVAVLQDALSVALRNVFYTGIVVSALAMLVVLRLPAKAMEGPPKK